MRAAAEGWAPTHLCSNTQITVHPPRQHPKGFVLKGGESTSWETAVTMWPVNLVSHLLTVPSMEQDLSGAGCPALRQVDGVQMWPPPSLPPVTPKPSLMQEVVLGNRKQPHSTDSRITRVHSGCYCFMLSLRPLHFTQSRACWKELSGSLQPSDSGRVHGAGLTQMAHFCCVVNDNEASSYYTIFSITFIMESDVKL